MNQDAAENGTPIPVSQPLPQLDGKEVLTFSSINTFRNCAKKFDYRYQHQLSGERGEALYMGTLVHDALEAYCRAMMAQSDDDYRAPEVKVEQAMAIALKKIDNECGGHDGDPNLHHRWHHAKAMVKAYLNRWADNGPDALGQVMDHEYELVDVEKEFTAPIVNPETGSPSRTFVMAGKVDGVIRLKSDGRLYILERKTAASVDGGYIAKLWSDFQSMLYAHYLSGIYGEQFGGVLYDVIGKKKHKQTLAENDFEFEDRVAAERKKTEDRLREKGPKIGETDEEFATRLAGYKTAKTRDKHLEIGAKPSETPEEFEARIVEAMDKREAKVREDGPREMEPDDEFHERIMVAYRDYESQTRELILFDSDRLAVISEEVWDITKQLLAARSRGRFGMNTSQCYSWNRPCDFVEACKAGRLDAMTMFGLEQRTPHSELDLVSGNAAKTNTAATDPVADEDLPF